MKKCVKTLEDFSRAWHAVQHDRAQMIAWLHKYVERELHGGAETADVLSRVEQSLRDARRAFLQATEGRNCIKDKRDRDVYTYASGEMAVLFHVAECIAYV